MLLLTASARALQNALPPNPTVPILLRALLWTHFVSVTSYKKSIVANFMQQVKYADKWFLLLFRSNFENAIFFNVF